MWKYQCKRQLLFILSGFIFGVFLFGILQYQNDMMKDLLKEVAVSIEGMVEGMNANEIYSQLISIPFFIPLLGGISVAGIVNGISLFFYLVQKFQLNFFFVFILLFLGIGNLAYQLGSILLLPSLFVYIYGWLTIPRGSKVKNKTSIAEIEHKYTLHHKLDETYRTMAKTIARNIVILNSLLGLGAILVVLLMLYVQDIMVMLMGMLIFLFLSFYTNKKKSVITQPVLSLLFDRCDPQACASTIFYLSKYLLKRKKFVLTPVLSQCMIYLDDPHLAIEILTLDTIQNKKTSQHNYYSLMAYAYYQLGDKTMVQHQFDSLEREIQNVKKTPFVFIMNRALQAIQNKIDMLNQNFSNSELYYQRLFNTTPLLFQKVDASYYLGLLSFIQKDYRSAQTAFSFVVKYGNTLYFTQKAKQYLEKLEKLIEEE